MNDNNVYTNKCQYFMSIFYVNFHEKHLIYLKVKYIVLAYDIENN
jgi:hypothetical protein